MRRRFRKRHLGHGVEQCFLVGAVPVENIAKVQARRAVLIGDPGIASFAASRNAAASSCAS